MQPVPGSSLIDALQPLQVAVVQQRLLRGPRRHRRRWPCASLSGMQQAAAPAVAAGAGVAAALPAIPCCRRCRTTVGLLCEAGAAGEARRRPLQLAEASAGREAAARCLCCRACRLACPLPWRGSKHGVGMNLSILVGQRGPPRVGRALRRAPGVDRCLGAGAARARGAAGGDAHLAPSEGARPRCLLPAQLLLPGPASILRLQIRLRGICMVRCPASASRRGGGSKGAAAARVFGLVAAAVAAPGPHHLLHAGPAAVGRATQVVGWLPRQAAARQLDGAERPVPNRLRLRQGAGAAPGGGCCYGAEWTGGGRAPWRSCALGCRLMRRRSEGGPWAGSQAPAAPCGLKGGRSGRYARILVLCLFTSLVSSGMTEVHPAHPTSHPLAWSRDRQPGRAAPHRQAPLGAPVWLRPARRSTPRQIVGASSTPQKVQTAPCQPLQKGERRELAAAGSGWLAASAASTVLALLASGNRETRTDACEGYGSR